MSVARGEAWKKYLDHYQYLLQYPLDKEYPYKELADGFGLDVVVVRYMVEWIQKKSEVIAWLRSQYSDEALPDGVGELQEGFDYEELLRSKGVELPVAEAPMEEGAEGEGS